MKKYFLKPIIAIVLFTGIATSCTKKLDLLPTNDITADVVYSTPLGYKQSLAKVYGSFALTGNNGSGSGDVQGIDPGTSDFFRLFWKAQELTTDEAVVAWGDPGIQDLHLMSWSSANPLTQGLYYRSMYQITLANDFIRQSADAKVAGRGITGLAADSIKKYRLEARFLRAYQYWVLMDLFGNPPFVTENDALGSTLPKQISRKNLFTYIETELKAIEPDLIAARSNEYGRADRAACQALLARLYLNAEVYTGTAKYTDAATYAKKVIDAGYTPIANYRDLMLADNNTNTSENIFTINYDGLQTQNYGGTTFIKNGSIGGSMNSADYGTNQAWSGLRTTKALVNLFPDVTGTLDKRGQFYTAGQSLDINDLTKFTDGYAITKFRNKSKTNVDGKDQVYSDIDMPIFRITEMYLVYAEAVLRGGTGDATLALTYVNAIRTRAYAGSTAGNITVPNFNLDFVLNERARELYWEGFRRTDLIRYNRFVESTYVWPWKGGSKDGTGVSTFRKIFPLPSSDVSANSNLIQNPGY